MRYSVENPYVALGQSGLPYVSTERFGVDCLLGRDVSSIDRYVVYVPSSDFGAWRSFLTSIGAKSVDILGNLIFLNRENFADLSSNKGVAPLEVLAHDLRVMSPRYLTRIFTEIQRDLPFLAELILKYSSPDALNLSDKNKPPTTNI